MKSHTFFIWFSLVSIMLLSSACQEQPTRDEVPALLDRAEKIQLDKEWDTVQNAYSKNKLAITQDDDDHNARLNLAYIFIQEARVTGEHGHYYPAALEVLDEIIAANPTDRDIQFRTLATKAGVQLSLHDFADAHATALSAMALNKHNAQIYGVLTDANVELGNYNKAVEYADRMIAIKPDLRSYARISYLREIHGDIDGAMKAFRLSIEAGVPGYEDRAWAMQTLGEILMKYEREEEAEEIFKTILDERENYPFAIAALGDLAYNAGDLSAAEAKYNQAADIIPEVGFYISLAKIYKDQGRDQELENTLGEVMEMLEDDVVHGHNMNLEYASLYLELLEDNDKAMEYAKEEYEKRPTNIDVNKMMAEVYVAQDDIDSARPYIARAASTNSVDPAIIALQKVSQEGQLSLSY